MGKKRKSKNGGMVSIDFDIDPVTGLFGEPVFIPIDSEEAWEREKEFFKQQMHTPGCYTEDVAGYMDLSFEELMRKVKGPK